VLERDSSDSPQGGAPQLLYKMVYKHPMNTIVIGTINHSDIGVINQLSYLGGPTLYNIGMYR